VQVPVADDHNALAYVIGGAARFGPGARNASTHELVLFEKGGTAVEVTGPDHGVGPGEVLVLTGRPLDEPVARYGPFVMNSRSELLEAVEDYQAGRMGQIAR
jgi:redox-sensitive bicupin YhaK (pirin superfamily)